MGRTQAQLYSLIRATAPGWLWHELEDADAFMWGWAKILERFEADLDTHLTATEVLQAAGNDLGLHLLDHGLVKATDETEPHQRVRIAAQLQVRAVTRPGILALLSDIVIGEIIIRANKRDGPYFDRQHFLDRRYYVPGDREDFGFVVYIEAQADPATYIAAWVALSAAAGGCIPARLEVMA